MTEPAQDGQRPSGNPLTRDALVALWVEQEPCYGLVFLDAGGIVTALTPAAQQLLGYSAAELIGKPLSTFFTRGDRALHLPLHEMEVAAKTGHSEDDRWHRRSDGSLVWIGGSLTRLRDESGALCGFAKIVRDRTDLRTQAEALNNRAVQSAKEQGGQAPRINAAALDLDSVARSIAEAVRLLSTASGEERVRLQAGLRQEVADLQRVADVLRKLGAPRQFPGPLRLSRVELQTVLADLVENLQPAAGAGGVSLEVLMPLGTIQLQADAARLRQVVTSLVANAIKHTPSGGNIWVKATLEDRAAVVRVEDTGAGIEGHKLRTLFDLFTAQADGALALPPLTRELDLAGVRDLVVLHGGTVEVRSDGAGLGCQFGVRFPVEGAVSHGAALPA